MSIRSAELENNLKFHEGSHEFREGMWNCLFPEDPEGNKLFNKIPERNKLYMYIPDQNSWLGILHNALTSTHKISEI